MSPTIARFGVGKGLGLKVLLQFSWLVAWLKRQIMFITHADPAARLDPSTKIEGFHKNGHSKTGTHVVVPTTTVYSGGTEILTRV